MDALIKRNTVRHLKRAVSTLKGPQPSAGVWHALDSLTGLAESGHRITIDVAVSEEVGAPVIVVSEPSQTGVALASLTPRQSQVAAMILRGLPNKQIARELGISVGTAKDHVHAILERLELPSRAALIARFARQQKLTAE